MNILHMKYAVEVARLGSLNKAAEVLIVAQPNISRSIKELEADLGITIFNRSARGMVLTPEGEEFISYAQSILKQIDEVEMIYKQGSPKKQKLSVSAPHSCYISEAFVKFSASISDDPAEIFYEETNAQKTIGHVLNNDYKLGIIRYAEHYDKIAKAMLEEKGLAYEMITEFSAVLTMSCHAPLSGRQEIRPEDLTPYIEIENADPYIPALPPSKTVKEDLPDHIERRIFTADRANQLELLAENPMTFMWGSPISQTVLNQYGLVQKACANNRKIYKDVLIYREGYHLTKLDHLFVTALCESRRKHLK